VPTLRLFAAAREAAGRSVDEMPGATVAELLSAARARYGAPFAEVLAVSGVWVNGEPAASDTAVGEGDEVAVLPPVSGGIVPADPVSGGRGGR
jgi:molybdopterin synthase sulfur carrier subunit